MAVDPPDLVMLDQFELELVASQCKVLGLQQPQTLEGVRVGQSGSLVVRLLSPGSRIVLKVTTAIDRLDQARLELQLVASPDLAPIMARYVAGNESRDLVTVATEVHDPLPHATAITDNDWTLLAAALGSLHRMPVPRWVNLPRAMPPQTAAVAASTRVWAGRVPAALAAAAAEIFERDLTAWELDNAGLVLEHGDCHIENIVRDSHGRLRWIDWQEARVGDGFSDLVFLWQRAEFAGARPPREAMTRAYLAARGLTVDRDVRRTLDVAEFRLLLLAWPPFLDYGSTIKPAPPDRPAGRPHRLSPMTVHVLSVDLQHEFASPQGRLYRRRDCVPFLLETVFPTAMARQWPIHQILADYRDPSRPASTWHCAPGTCVGVLPHVLVGVRPDVSVSTW